MTKTIIAKLQRAWRGPAITVKLPTQTFTFGAGESRATIIIHKKSLLTRLIRHPALAFGEAYMDGHLSIEGDLMAILEGFHRTGGLPTALTKRAARNARRPISTRRARANAQHHYDIGNNFYALWLDQSRTYSCAYFEKGTETLDQAQAKKIDLICRKLRLAPGHTLLDIGAGWGALVLHAVRTYGVTATAVTPAAEQAAYIKQQAEDHGIADRLQVIAEDWRTLTGRYDRVVSVGMFEHVGARHYPQFFRQWQSLLDPTGVSLLHTIARRRPGVPDPWITKYIFPGGYLPTVAEITTATSTAGPWLYRLENLKPHYTKTLEMWANNFAAARQDVTAMFDERFARMWWLYLKGSEAGFRFGELELLQFELYGPKANLPLDRGLELDSSALLDDSPTQTVL